MAKNATNGGQMTAEQAMAELWGILCPDAGPENYRAILYAAKKVLPPANYHQQLALGDEVYHEGQKRWVASIEADSTTRQSFVRYGVIDRSPEIRYGGGGTPLLIDPQVSLCGFGKTPARAIFDLEQNQIEAAAK